MENQNNDAKIFLYRKIIDHSIYEQGTTIPRGSDRNFDEFIGYHLERGENTEVT